MGTLVNWTFASKKYNKTDASMNSFEDWSLAMASLKSRILLGIGVLGLSVGAYMGLGWWTEGRFIESTDNAYVQADIAVIAPKLGGYVTQVAVQDNQVVNKGDLLARIDDADARVRLAAAQAALERARAAASTAGVDIQRQAAAIAQARAQIAFAQADAARAKADLDRYAKLRAEQWASVQKFDTAKAQAAQASASVAAAEAGADTSAKQLRVLSAKQSEAVAQIHAAEAEVAAAQLDVDNTQIRAPMAGVVGNRTVRVGNYVRPGAQLMAVVPVREAYVVANFKETQLAAMRPGQLVSLEVDAYPGVTLTGRVESFAPASGSQFALLPPENATGNFTKIVQRIPVRITLDPLPRDITLRPGMSVVAAIDTRKEAVAPRAERQAVLPKEPVLLSQAE
jgi:membrane fusion protein, multidrug efflux system